MMFISVLLPEPLAPQTATDSPVDEIDVDAANGLDADLGAALP
jgi:hypothetical protein